MSANTLLPQMKFQVQEQIVDTKSLLDENNFYHQRQGVPAELTKKLTYIMGNSTRNYPLSTMTLGGVGYNVGTSAIELDDVQFTYPVMGRRNKVSVTYSTEYSAPDEPGKGNAPFYITFSDNWIKHSYVIQSEAGIQAYVHEAGEPVAGGYRYKCTLDGDPNASVPLNQLEPGVKWVELFTQVAESESRSTESKMIMPGKFKNQMSFMRAGISWAGNVANKIMNINIKTSKGETDVWMDWAMWQFEERWAEECEHLYWYNRYNRAIDGTVALKDMLTGKIIPRGSGVLEQIANKSTYAKLTYNILSNKVGDALFGQSDAMGMNITLMTGTGGKREFHRAMMSQGAQFFATFGLMGDKFLTGSNYNLMLGGYFDGFYHIDGYTIKVKHNPIFDTGRVAQGSPLHPESGLPLESYRMVFIDDGDVDGQPNIQHVAQKGRAYMDGVSTGLTNMPRSIQILLGGSGNGQYTKLLSSVQDKAEYTRFKSAGIQLLRGNRCFDLQCVAGL